MTISNQLTERLKYLGWTLYKLAKRFAEIRATNGDASPAMRYHTAVGKAMENLAKSRLETVETIVQALGGELKIEWQQPNKPDKTMYPMEPVSWSLRYQVKFFSSGQFAGMTYADTFCSALKTAIDYHSTNAFWTAEVWREDEKLCSSDEIIQIVAREQMQFTTETEHNNSGYVVIRE